ncbi:hypothetical protein [Actinomadura sp. WMMA1423]|uniref:hypothetical protein n=1 Tax=Actinomadura sp. WMMA1423 TaxID=2591108 RepID=UPI001146EE1B|nr:hypothetical protein [Actinomadura sp. WMMA1423]
MKDRRKLRVGAVSVALPAMVAGGVYALPATSDGSISPLPAAAPGKADFVIKKGASRTKTVDALDKKLKKSGVQALLNAKGNRKLRAEGSKGCPPKGASVPGKALAYCWAAGEDSSKQRWIPQGVSSVSDAKDNEKWGKAGYTMVVTWYAPKAKNIRVTFVNLRKRTYRHVLLVMPGMTKGKKASYRDIKSHAGGVTWYGNHLYVAETQLGLRVFDMRRIFDLGKSKNGTTKKKGRVGLHGKTYYGHGYRYVMPQVGSWLNAKGKGPLKNCKASGPPKWSWVSVDRSGVDSLVTGEYCPEPKDPGQKAPNGRMATWPLRNGKPRTGGDGYARALAVSPLPVKRVQGGVTAYLNGGEEHAWFGHNAKGAGARPGVLLHSVWNRSKGRWEKKGTQSLAKGPEDLSCYRGQGRIWTVAEHAKARALYGVPVNKCG